MTARATTLALLALAVLLVLPEAASACPMCMAGSKGGTQRAFALGSLFLSITPLAAIGVVAWYVRRRARVLAAEEAARAEPTLPVAGIAAQR